ncbi:hypothetical protein Q428_10190 [Fervidicella metallireducens AeB]|uniref:Uncharacterized protein n=1 Tax=Fervidicella metallireducens AeB TaxID=1403537 RepID=A0A017RTF7_9CLOT|nr:MULTISPECIES: hypothetical protein [Clostridiaceae]EYE88018.1 hypothetical protein Q428_10190 [Fervidicella metallireducens AeB]
MAVHKCKRCIWSNKINDNILYCIFPRCIMKETISENVTANGKESIVIPKARTNCDDKTKRRKRNVSSKT